jgi:hypothetical protein
MGGLLGSGILSTDSTGAALEEEKRVAIESIPLAPVPPELLN